MKKLLLLIGLTLIQVSLTMGQWTSPGNGTTYTLRDLVALSEGCVTHETGTGAYHFHQDLTIAPHDCLTVVPEDFTTIDADAGGILCHGNVLLTIKGGLVIDCGDIDVYLEPDSVSRLRVVLDHSTEASRFVHTKMFYMSGIQVIESAVSFDDCLFQSFDKTETNGAIQYRGCDPVLTGCIFQGNYGSAISGVNGSPQIDRCEFRYNVLSKEDMPQLDFHLGGADTLRLLNSKVVGLYPLVGGIMITDPREQEGTKVLVQGCFIADNRYGYCQQGLHVDALLRDNQIVCNQIAPNPANDGFGVCLQDQTKATLRHNLLHSNLWGVLVQGQATLDMGTADDYGHNILYNNHNGSNGTDQAYALYLEGSNDASAVGNYWGGATEEFAEGVIYHRPDLGADHGLVAYLPILTVNDWSLAETSPSAPNAYPNPTEGLFVLAAGQGAGFTYEVYTLTGQQVLQGAAEGATATVDLQAFPAGVYTVVARSAQGTVQTVRLIKR